MVLHWKLRTDWVVARHVTSHGIQRPSSPAALFARVLRLLVVLACGRQLPTL